MNFKEYESDFVNTLTSRCRRVWKARCEGRSVASIAQALGVSVGTICGSCYHIRGMYKKWQAMKGLWQSEYINELSDGKYIKSIAHLRYGKGQGISVIADELGITPQYTRVLLYRIRKQLRASGLTV